MKTAFICSSTSYSFAKCQALRHFPSSRHSAYLNIGKYSSIISSSIEIELILIPELRIVRCYMNTTAILSYLSDLEQHNEKGWYHTHRIQYQEADTAFIELLSKLIWEIGKTDTSIIHNDPHDLTFKLVRDTRFSHDKSPYNPCFRAHISSAGKLPVPVGYYIKIQPGNRSFLGGGLFADMFQDATSKVRDYIAAHGAEWQRIMDEDCFSETFRVKGTCLKNVPRGYDSTHPQAEYLKNKSWYLEYPVSDDQLQQDSFIAFAADIFQRMQPFNAFLNNALSGFVMPGR